MTDLPLTEARNRLSELVDGVQRTHDRVTITRHGKVAAVLVSADCLQALDETLDVLANEDVMRRLAQSRAAVASGDVLDAEEFAAFMARRRGET